MADNEEELLGGADLSSTNLDHIDEDQLLGETSDENPFQVKQEELDLFDAAIEPSGADKDTSATATMTNNTSTPTTPSLGITTNAGITFSNSAANIANITGKKYCCYIGNMTWWTTDDDLVKAINGCGVEDLVDLKFYENRTNGQSKGFCLAVFLTDQSVRTITEKMPLRPVHGQTLVVLPYSKISLARLEEASAKSSTRVEQKKPKEENGMLNMGTIRIGANGITPLGPGGAPVPIQQPPMMGMNNMGMMGQRPPMGGVPMGGPMQMMGGPMGRGGGPPMQQQPPQQMILPQTRIMPGGMVMSGGPQMMGGPQQQRPQGGGGGVPPMAMTRPPPGMGGAPPPTGPPQPLMGRPLAAPPNVGSAGFPAGAHINPNVYPGFAAGADQPPPTEAEADEIMTRNRTISSSAISRAISDATSGNHADAIETLLTAISLIKQSRVANDERCKLLISSLHDTLSGIEVKMKERKRDRRDRSRSRSRERKHRRRSRTRSRSPRRKY